MKQPCVGYSTYAPFLCYYYRQRFSCFIGRSHKTLQKVLSELPNVPERVILNYSLTKTENESFGVTIVGGIGTMVQDIYIKSVSKNGVCGINDTLKVGAYFMSVTTFVPRVFGHFFNLSRSIFKT